MKYQVRRVDYNDQLINLIKKNTNESYKQILVYFYSLAKLTIEDAFKRSKAGQVRKKIAKTYPKTDIPFHLNVYSYWSRDGRFDKCVQNDINVDFSVEIRFPNSKKVLSVRGDDEDREIGSWLEEWSTDLVEEQIGLKDKHEDIDKSMEPRAFLEKVPRGLKDKI
jgi:hypothetical protein